MLETTNPLCLRPVLGHVAIHRPMRLRIRDAPPRIHARSERITFRRRAMHAIRVAIRMGW